MTRLFTVRRHINGRFHEVGFARVQHRAQAAWPEHAVGDTMFLHRGRLNPRFNGRWPFEFDSLAPVIRGGRYKRR
jgi:hypothetical protein